MNDQRRMLVIVNNRAARARRTWPRIESALAQNHVRFCTHATAHAGDATDAVRAALRAGHQIIAVIGGDGTLSEAAQGFFESGGQNEEPANKLPRPVNAGAALAIIPAGTGNDFARGLAGRREADLEWVEALIAYYHGGRKSATLEVDVIAGSANDSTHQFICLNVATIGLGAEVAGRVAAQGRLMQRLPGEARFVAAACGSLARWRERRVRVAFEEGRRIECTSNLIAVANGMYAGGGMKFAPAALLDDGQMDVLISCGITRATILRELPRIRRGDHLTNTNVRAMKVKHVRIETLTPEDALPVEADGNVRGHTPAEFRILPAALRVIKMK
jgi:YegS/Rv2252/BmrU family lipid kinase